MVSNFLRQCGAWVTAWWQSLANNLLRRLFATEILGSQKLFISNVSHELRTPLSVIKTTSEVALLDPGLSREARRTFVEIVQELTRVSEILDNLLSLNTLSGGEGMQFQNLDMSAVVEESAKRLTPLARERGVKLTVRLKRGSIAVGNRAALETIAHHIIKNALSFTPMGGTVLVEVYPEGSGVALKVADSGVGMSGDELAHIFEPFYRADTSRNRSVRGSGAGLGLTIAHAMVEAHQGTITINSKKRAGTIVTVVLPRGGFISRSGGEEYSTKHPAQRGTDGAHEPHRGRRYFTASTGVTKGIPGS